MASAWHFGGRTIKVLRTFLTVDDSPDADAAPLRRSASCPPSVKVEGEAVGDTLGEQKRRRCDVAHGNSRHLAAAGSAGGRRGKPTDVRRPAARWADLTDEEEDRPAAEGALHAAGPRQQDCSHQEPSGSGAAVAVLKNLPSRCREESVWALIRQAGFAGHVAEFNMPRRREGNGRTLNKGFAFVRFADPAACELFARAVDGHVFGERASGKAITVKIGH